MVSETLTTSAVANKVRLIGATSSGAYAQYIAGNELLDSLFKQVNLADDLSSSEQSDKDDANATNSNGFQGEKISADLQQLIQRSSRKDRVSVILQVDDVTSGRLNDFLKQYGVTINAQMAHLGSLQAEVPVKALAELAARTEVHHVSLNSEVRAFGHVSATTGADAVRQQTRTTLLGGTTSYTLDGSGIGVAILDSGIDSAHKSFLGNNNNGRVVFSKDFTGENRVDDPYGHGTHVAAAAAGNANAGAAFMGIAPGASLLNVRVLDSDGHGTVESVLAGLDWIAANARTYNIRLVNMSLGSQAVESYKYDPMCRSIRALTNSGILFFVAAGNDGKDTDHEKVFGTIHAPGIEPSAVTIGAVNTFQTDQRSDDGIASYSSRGPTRSYWV